MAAFDLARLSWDELQSEANLAADLVLAASASGNTAAETEADELFIQLLAELSRREGAALEALAC